MKKAAILLLFLSACTLGDDVPPGTPSSVLFDTNLRHLSWVSTGDDGDHGRGALTDVRAAFDPDDASQAAFRPENVADTVVMENVPGSGLSQTPREYLVRRLSLGRPVFLLVAQRDEVGNVGPFATASGTDENADGSVFTNLLDLVCPLGSTPSLSAIAAGDLDGLPGDDIAVGDPDNNRVLLFYGEPYRPFDLLPAARFCEPDAVLDGALLGGRFGAALSIGDVDGDGAGELLIGAPDFDRNDGLGPRGAVFLVRAGGQRSAPGDFLSIQTGPQQGYVSKVMSSDPPFIRFANRFTESVAGNREQQWTYYSGTPMLAGTDAASLADPVHHVVNGRLLDGVQEGWLFEITSGPNLGFRCRIHGLEAVLPDVLRIVRCDPAVRNAQALTPATGQSWRIYRDLAAGRTLVTVKDSPFLVMGGLRKPVTALSLTGAGGTSVPQLAILGPVPVANSLPSGFGEVIEARGDINDDRIADVVLGLSGLDGVSWAERDVPLAERGAVFVLFGDGRFTAITGEGPNTLPSGIRDLARFDARPDVVFLGENAGDRLGTSVATGVTARTNPATPEAEDPMVPYFGLAMGAPGAVADGRASAGKVYAFLVDRYLKSRDWRAPGSLSDGVYNFSDPDGPDGPLLSDHGHFEIWGAEAGDRIGLALELGGDFNLDSVADLAVLGAGTGGEGILYQFLVTPYHPAPPQAYVVDPDVTGGSPFYPVQTINMGNRDVNRRVDLNGDSLLDPHEDRCVFCILNLAEPDIFGLPQVAVVGGPDAVVTGPLFAADTIPDGLDDLSFLAETPAGTVPVVLNGLVAGTAPWVAPDADVCTITELVRVVQIYSKPEDVALAVESALRGRTCDALPRVRGKIRGRASAQQGIDPVLDGNDGSLGAVGRDFRGRVTIDVEPIAVAPRFFRRLEEAAPDAGNENTVRVHINRLPLESREVWGPVLTTGRPPEAGYFTVPPAAYHGAADVSGDGQPDFIVISGSDAHVLH